MQSYSSEAIFVGWLVSATMLDKALEAWMHHDASWVQIGAQIIAAPGIGQVTSKLGTAIGELNSQIMHLGRGSSAASLP